MPALLDALNALTPASALSVPTNSLLTQQPTLASVAATTFCLPIPTKLSFVDVRATPLTTALHVLTTVAFRTV